MIVETIVKEITAVGYERTIVEAMTGQTVRYLQE
jgi:hypothetical protein